MFMSMVSGSVVFSTVVGRIKWLDEKANGRASRKKDLLRALLCFVLTIGERQCVLLPPVVCDENQPDGDFVSDVVRCRCVVCCVCLVMSVAGAVGVPLVLFVERERGEESPAAIGL